ncbi:MAG: hypothetical protein IJV61_01855 [Paludibacteraceae bacterium]|nr:hypothetical protein [Paludibacteraceae bacterium]
MKQKLFTLFAALLLAGSMSASVTIHIDHAITYMIERDGLSLWDFALYSTEANDYPGLGISTFRTNDSIAGTQTVVGQYYIMYAISEEDFIMPPQYSNLVVSRIRSGLYHYSFSFEGHFENGGSPDEEYIVDAEVPTEIHNLAGEIIEEAYKPEGIEDIHEDSDQPVKFLHNGQIFLLRGDRTYTLQGQEVK